MITPGEVRAVRELKNGVQAEVCIAASVEHGSAIVKVECASAEVKEAMARLKTAISKEAQTMLRVILADQKEWDAEKAASKKPLQIQVVANRPGAEETTA